MAGRVAMSCVTVSGVNVGCVTVAVAASGTTMVTSMATMTMTSVRQATDRHCAEPDGASGERD